MRKLFLFLLLLPAVLWAKDLHEGDTLWLNDQMNMVKSADATRYGYVKQVDTVSNVATVHLFTLGDKRLIAIRHVVATGKGAGLRKGKQIYFDENGKTQSMEVYTLVNDELKGKVRNRLAAETILYPDGKTKEELTISYEMIKGKEHSTTDRKCFYPDGALQYEEHADGEELKTVYYKPNGKVTKHPKEKIPPYMTMPDFPGGQEALFEFLTKEVRYPAEAQENGKEGRVIVQFVVATDGKIEEVKVVRSGGDPSLDREAVRVVSAMPKWFPGKKRGVPTRVKYTVPVNFRLD